MFKTLDKTEQFSLSTWAFTAAKELSGCGIP
jgi:hypothetical protein